MLDRLRHVIDRLVEDLVTDGQNEVSRDNLEKSRRGAEECMLAGRCCLRQDDSYFEHGRSTFAQSGESATFASLLDWFCDSEWLIEEGGLCRF